MTTMLDRPRRFVRGTPHAVRRFDAAGGGRRWQGNQSFGNLVSEVGGQGETIRRRSAYYARNNALLANAISSIVANAIGTGIRPVSRHPDPSIRAQILARWERWSEECDVEGVSDFPGLQATATRTLIEGGEVFPQLLNQPEFRLRLLDGAMVPMDSAVLSPERQVVQGVEIDAMGRRLAYHVLRYRPELLGSVGYDKVRIAATDLLHMFCPLGPGQIRGIAWTTSVLLRLNEIDLYEDAQLMRQKVSAMFTGYIVDPNGQPNQFDGTSSDGILNSALEPGTLKVLGPGQDVRFSDPAKIGSDNLEFIRVQVRAVAAGMGVPAYHVDGDLSQANYSSLRAAMVEFRRRIEQLQYNTIVFQFCRPVWKRFIMTEVLAGRLQGNIEQLLLVEWVPPRLDWVDPVKDVAAVAEAIRLGLISRSGAVAELGLDIEALDAQIAADRAREKTLGLDFTPSTGAKSNAADPQQ